MANINFQSTLIRMSRDVFMKVGGLYNATSYWTERSKISSFMLTKLNEELITAYATCESLQIIRIDLPKSFEDSIVATQVEVQKTNMRKFEQTAELVRQDIGVLVSQAQQVIKVTNATASAEAFRIKQYAEALALKNTIEAETNAYLDAKNKIGLSGNDFTNYVYYTNLMNKDNSKLLIGLQNSIVNFGGNSPV